MTGTRVPVVGSVLRGGVLADDVSFLLARANAVSLAHANRVLAEFELKVRSFSVLALAAGGSGPTQRDLSEYLRLDPSQVVQLIDELQRRDLVVRGTDPRDRRANIVAATAAGSDLWRRADLALRAGERELHAGFTEHEREVLSDLLRRIAFADQQE